MEAQKRSRAEVRAAYRSEIWLSEKAKPCDGRAAEFVDYMAPPSRERAAELCAGCPFKRETCLEFGQAGKADGVYGGEVLKDGRRVHRALAPELVG